MRYFQHMLKMSDSMKAFEKDAAHALESILKAIPIITLESVEVEPRVGRHEIDVLVRLTAAHQPHVLVCEIKYSGQPRHVRQGLLQLRNYLEHSNQPATPV